MAARAFQAHLPSVCIKTLAHVASFYENCGSPQFSILCALWRGILFDLGIGVARDFTAENWAKTAPADRHFMVSSLRETVALAGMDEAEVRTLLGEPDYADTSERLSYIIDTGIDDTTLDLTMANGKVIDISDNNPH